MALVDLNKGRTPPKVNLKQLKIEIGEFESQKDKLMPFKSSLFS